MLPSLANLLRICYRQRHQPEHHQRPRGAWIIFDRTEMTLTRDVARSAIGPTQTSRGV